MILPKPQTHKGVASPMSGLLSPLALLCLVMLLLLSTFAASVFHSADNPDALSPLTGGTSSLQPIAHFPDSSLAFIPNKGQISQEVQFHAHSPDGALFFTTGGVLIASPDSSSLVELRFEGANPTPTLASGEPLPGVVNYLIGNDATAWHTNLPTYRTIHYEQLYPGIDMRYDGPEGMLKSTYTVAPGADPSRIRWRYEGATGLALDAASGDLLITLDGHQKPALIEQAPTAWQDIDGQRFVVEVRYTLQQHADSPTVGLEVGHYDPAHPLVIDPTIIRTVFLGAGSDDIGHSLATDSEGNVYITGQTNSAVFPGAGIETANPPGSVPGQPDDVNPDNAHVFLAKYDPDGNRLYTSYFGGDAADVGLGIAVDRRTIQDEEGEEFCHPCSVYITGFTQSPNFPISNALATSNSGGSDIFVTKVLSSGVQFAYSTYLGGADDETGYDIAVDEEGQAYLTGESRSNNFPLANATQATFGGGTVTGDAIITVLSENGQELRYSTYVGGSGEDSGQGIALARNGDIAIAGVTASTDFPVDRAVQATSGGLDDAFIARFTRETPALVYSTYLGGSGSDEARDIALDPIGNIYITGVTDSPNFPTEQPVQPAKSADTDAFITRLNANGASLGFSTYLGGGGPDEGYDIVVDSANRTLVTGRTRSEDFPEVSTLLRPAGRNEAFVTQMSEDGTALSFSTYLAGEADDEGRAIVFDSVNNTFYVAGFANSASRFPGSPEAHGGGSDAFISKFAASDVLLDGDASVVEGDDGTTAMVFPVRLTSPIGEDIRVHYRTRDGVGEEGATAADGDYVAVQDQIVTIPSGATEAEAVVSINGDVKDELHEQFTIELFDASGDTAILDAEATGTIRDNDPGVIIEPPQPASIPENTVGGVNFQVKLINNLTQESATPSLVSGEQWRHPLTVEYATVNGSAVGGQDFEVKRGTLTFDPAGAAEQTINIALTDDDRAESQESFSVALSNVVSTASLVAALSEAQVTLLDNDQNGIVIQDPDPIEQEEGDSDSRAIVFTVELPLANPVPVTVDYTTEEGSATALEDFIPEEGTLTFAACTEEDVAQCPAESIRQTIDIQIVGDTENEQNETFTVRLSNATGGTNIVKDTSEFTILNDDIPDISFLDTDMYTVDEGAPGDTVVASIPVVLSSPSVEEITINYATSSGVAGQNSSFLPAQQDADYAPASGSLTFAPGSTREVFEVLITSDDVGEPHKFVDVTLSDPTGATLVDPSTTSLVIFDDDPFPTFTLSDEGYQVWEDGGQAPITVTLANANTIAEGVAGVTANFATLEGGTATSESDYTPAEGEITLAAPFTGTNETAFTVPILNDEVDDPDEETVIVGLTTPRPLDAVRIGPPLTATLTILDDEINYFVYLPLTFGRQPGLFFDQALYSAIEGSDIVTVTVTLDDPTTREISVGYDIVEDEPEATALPGSDYEPVTGTLTFEPGETEQTFTIPILDDTEIEPDEIFFIRLRSPTGGAALRAATATVEIRDDDFVPSFFRRMHSAFSARE